MGREEEGLASPQLPQAQDTETRDPWLTPHRPHCPGFCVEPAPGQTRLRHVVPVLAGVILSTGGHTVHGQEGTWSRRVLAEVRATRARSRRKKLFGPEDPVWCQSWAHRAPPPPTPSPCP